MTLGEMIRKYREENGLSQRDFARLAGISNVSVSYFERNEKPKTGKPITASFETYSKIANVMGIDIDTMFRDLDLASVSLMPNNLRLISELNMKRIPLIGKVAAGEPIIAEEDHSVVITGPEKADYALEIQGESMSPTYLPGDIIYVRRQSTLDYQGQVAVVLLDDEATVKHVYRQKDGLLLISDNPAYEPMTKRFEDFASVRILGKVCGYTRMYRE